MASNPITERKRAAKNGKPLKQIFKGKFISSVGQFENCGRILGPVDIAGYIENHGGVYEKEVTNRTTHLICSIEEYKRKHEQGTFFGHSPGHRYITPCGILANLN